MSQRKIIAIIIAVVFLGIALVIFLLGLAVGTLAGDGCPPGAEFGIAPLWLMVCWPVLLLVGAAAPAVLVWRGARIRWVVLAVVLGVLAAAAGFGTWLAIVQAICYNTVSIIL